MHFNNNHNLFWKVRQRQEWGFCKHAMIPWNKLYKHTVTSLLPLHWNAMFPLLPVQMSVLYFWAFKMFPHGFGVGEGLKQPCNSHRCHKGQHLNMSRYVACLHVRRNVMRCSVSVNKAFKTVCMCVREWTSNKPDLTEWLWHRDSKCTQMRCFPTRCPQRKQETSRKRPQNKDKRPRVKIRDRSCQHNAQSLAGRE